MASKKAKRHHAKAEAKANSTPRTSPAPTLCVYCKGVRPDCGFCEGGKPLDTQDDWDRSWGKILGQQG